MASITVPTFSRTTAAAQSLSCENEFGKEQSMILHFCVLELLCYNFSKGGINICYIDYDLLSSALLLLPTAKAYLSLVTGPPTERMVNITYFCTRARTSVCQDLFYV